MKILKKGQEARDALKRGIDLVADSVKLTIGPHGRNAVLGRLNITPIITNDGVTIAHHIEAEDPIEQNGVMIVREAAQLTDSNAGDGTTTTTVLLQALVQELFDKIKDDGSLLSKKVNTIDLKKEVDTWCEKVCAELKAAARPVTPEDIYNVALISAEHEWMAKMVADIYKQIGKDGFVTIEEGVKTSYKVFKGMELTGGYQSEYFINNDQRQCVIENPHILVTNQALEITALLPLAEEMAKSGVSELVIIAPDFTKDLISRLNTTKIKTGMSIVAVRQPTIGKDDLLVDLATLTKAKFLDKNTYSKYEDFAKDVVFANLGKAERAVIGEGTTIIVGGEGDTSARVEEIRKVHSETLSVFDKEKLEKRIAYLSGGIALIKVGGESEFEKSYFKLKMEDATNAVQVALKEGVVKGGGLALLKIADALPENILTNTLKAPYRQIQENAGAQFEIPDTVIDPVKITMSALKSACSLAGILVTTEISTANKREDSKITNHD